MACGDRGGRAELVDALTQGRSAHLLDETTSGSTWHFSHALIREALYEDFVSLERREWHRRVAETIVTLPNPDPDWVAYHFHQASDPRAVDWLIRAGERAERAYAWLTASERFAAALAVIPDDDSATRERVRLLIRVGHLCRYTEPRKGAAYLEAAARAAGDDRALAAFTSVELGMLRFIAGELRDGIVELESGAEALGNLTPAERAELQALGLDPGVANHRGPLVLFLATVGRFEEALAHGSRALAGLTPPSGYERLGSGYGDACQGMAEAYAGLGQPTNAAECFERGLAAYTMVEHHAMAGWTAAGAITWLLLPYRTDDLGERQRMARESDEAARRAGETIGGMSANHSCLPLLLLEGRWAEVRDLVEMTYAIPRNALLRLSAASSLGPLARHQGDTELAWSRVEEFIPDGPAVVPGNLAYADALPLLRLAAELALDANDLSTARAWLDAYEGWLDWSRAVSGRADGHLLRARYHLADMNRSLARQYAEQALA